MTKFKSKPTPKDIARETAEMIALVDGLQPTDRPATSFLTLVTIKAHEKNLDRMMAAEKAHEAAHRNRTRNKKESE